MEIIKFNLSRDWKDIDDAVVEEAARIIEQGRIIVYPTDTVYGLGVDAFNARGIERLFKMKKRPKTKPIPVMVKDIKMAKEIAFINPEREKMLKDVWPGRMTVILEKKVTVPDVLTGNKRTVGVRIPNHPFTKLLMEKINRPITIASANFSGNTPLISSFEVIKVFERAYPRPDLILDAGDLTENQTSTVLDLTSPQPKITRVGPISKNDLMKMFD